MPYLQILFLSIDYQCFKFLKNYRRSIIISEFITNIFFVNPFKISVSANHII